MQIDLTIAKLIFSLGSVAFSEGLLGNEAMLFCGRVLVEFPEVEDATTLWFAESIRKADK